MSTKEFRTNYIFRGDNLIFLKMLKQTHQNSIKCIYIDPPYNTGIDRKHFHDNRSSLEWTEMMRERLKILRSLLTEDGSIWMSIDDSELHNLRKVSEEIFGKENYLATITWQHKITWADYKGKFQLDHSYLLSFQKSDKFKFLKNYKPKTVWLEADTGSQQEAIQESNELFGCENAFSTPKPERLIRRILELTTEKNDIVLDCFAGSGTTGAAAQKLGRRWILIEIGNQCETHILSRMKNIAIQLDIFDEDIAEKANEHSFCYFASPEEYKSFIGRALLHKAKNPMTEKLLYIEV